MTDKRKPREANDAEIEITPHPPAPSPSQAERGGEVEVEAAPVLADAPDGEVVTPETGSAWLARVWPEGAGIRETGHVSVSGGGGKAEMVIFEGTVDDLIGDVQAIDVRTDGFITLRFTKADWPVGLRLGTMPRDDIRAVSGELGWDDKGLIAWFLRLPGEVTFRDGSRVILRDDATDGYVVDVK